MVSHEVIEELEAHFGEPIQRCDEIGGGCIANASRVEVGGRVYFLKWSTRGVSRTFPAEAAGLEALRSAGSPLFIPRVIKVQACEGEKPGILLMDWIEPGEKPPDFWEVFGRGLASLHRFTASRYGFDQDNFIGHIPQQNGWEDSWPTFFAGKRLGVQVEMARERGVWQRGWDPQYESLIDRLEELLPAYPESSILHGDLWSGNFLVTSDGTAALIDPAVYYGHREADLAMTELFGGFSESFYAAYREAWPLDDGYDERRDVYNLYHLINHLNHLGVSYEASVASILRRFR